MSNVTFTAKDLQNGVEKMNSFGVRTTGSKGHKDFIEYLKNEVTKMGLPVYSDFRKFNRWEAKNSSITLHLDGEDKSVKVSSPYPYSGVTGPEGITAPLQAIKGPYMNYTQCSGKIAVARIKDFKHLPSWFAFSQKSSFPGNIGLPKTYKGPVATAFVKFPLYPIAKLMGLKAIILVWEGMSDEMTEGQYLSFILGYMGIPCFWVNASDGKAIFDAAKSHKDATVVLEADREKKCASETFYSIIEGTNKDETIVINTHTDGINAVEENGAIGMLEMMKYFKEHKPDRTLIFVFSTGHFHLINFQVGIGQATSRWFHNHKELWDGKGKHKLCVADVGVEHLGCTEWKDVNGVYTQTNGIDCELVYTGNDKMEEIYYDAVKDRKLVRTITLRGHNCLHFGEGMGAFLKRIPEIALCTAPDYLCSEVENHHMDKFDADLMFEQTVTFIKCVEAIDKTSTEELGRGTWFSFGKGKNNG